MSDFLYKKQDLNNLKAAFSDYIDSPNITEPQFFLVGQVVPGAHLEERQNVNIK